MKQEYQLILDIDELTDAVAESRESDSREKSM